MAGAFTVWVTLVFDVPPEFEQVRVYVYDPVVFAPVLCVPLADFAPLHEPEALQLVGLSEADHCRVELAPELITAGVIDNVIVGFLTTGCVGDGVGLGALGLVGLVGLAGLFS